MRRKMIFKAFAAVFVAFGIISGFADTSPVAGVLHVSSDGVIRRQDLTISILL